jgi:RNA polymerase sigma factor (sigma-70 family)
MERTIERTRHRTGSAAPGRSRTVPGAERGVGELLQAAAGGERDAWAELIRRYDRLLRARTRSFGLQEADALDVIQATWLRLHENLSRIKDPERLPGWLNTTAGRECLRVIAQHRRSVAALDADFLVDQAAGPEQRLLEAERDQEVRAAVEGLPDGTRTVIRALFGAEPLSYAQLAGQEGIALGSIGPTRGRALSQLRRCLDRGGVAS